MIRASFLRDNVRMLHRAGPAAEAEVLSRVPHVVAALEASTSSQWMDARFDVEVARATFAVLGAVRGHAHYRELMVDSVKGPLLQPLFSGALRLFGRDPAQVLKWAPRGWDLAFRDAGRCRWDADAQIFALDALPELLFDVAWLDSVTATLEGLAELVGARDPRVVRSVDRAAARAVFEFAWRPH